jgi:hypothetical protein
MAVKRILLLAVCAAISSHASGAEVDYVTQIKPILAARCYACHSALRRQSGLRLDMAAFLAAGGDSGAAIVPGDADDSLLIAMLTGELGIRMPPEGEGELLSTADIDLLKQWIDEGAKAPEEAPPPDPRDHWAYQPVVRPAPPELADAAWAASPIDAFIAAQHATGGVTPLAVADRSVLLRRVYFDLVGLPPTPEEFQAFFDDDSPQAYERVVDRLLASPRHGERWGRHWMDIWRYSDWSGYLEEIRNSARHIWRWRDWIVESLNADKGYDRMVVEMLAGDELAPGDADTLRATGFLARNWFKFNRNTWLDSTVEHTAKAFLGATMNCARCHDHKYDPVSQVNYYQMRAVFEPHDVRTDRVPGQPDVLQDGLPRVCDVKPAEPTYVFTRGNEKQPELDAPLTPGVPEALGLQLLIEPVKLPATAYYPALREFVLEEDLAAAAKAIADREAARAAAQTQVATVQTKLNELAANGGDQIAAQKKLAAAVQAAELADEQLATARASQASLTARIAAEKAKHGLTPGADAPALALVAAKAERELALSTAHEQRTVAQGELTQAQAAAKPDDAATAAAVAAADAKVVAANAAIAAAHAALAVPAAEYQPLGEVLPSTSTGRRLALARWIVDRQNPLAARVAVNHIWMRHFGAPLVDNMFDFGLRSPSARNQPLLDWLAAELMDHRWQMKHIHRLIVTSRAYRMKSSDAAASEANLGVDPDNRLLWRMNPRRLEAEVVRDAMFYVAGKLDLSMGGPEIDYNLASQSRRRSLYLRHAYEKQAKFIEMFDGPSVNECYRRGESVVPQQALALANSDVSFVQSRHLAAQLSAKSASGPVPDAAFIRFAFERMLGREPTAAEDEQCTQFLAAQAQRLTAPEKLTAFTGGAKAEVEASTDPQQRARESLVHVLYNHNDFVTIR